MSFWDNTFLFKRCVEPFLSPASSSNARLVLSHPTQGIPENGPNDDGSNKKGHDEFVQVSGRAIIDPAGLIADNHKRMTSLFEKHHDKKGERKVYLTAVMLELITSLPPSMPFLNFPALQDAWNAVYPAQPMRSCVELHRVAKANTTLTNYIRRQKTKHPAEFHVSEQQKSDEIVARLKQVNVDEIARLKQENADEIARLKQEDAEEIARLKQENADEIARLKQEDAEEIARLNQENEELRKKLNTPLIPIRQLREISQSAQQLISMKTKPGRDVDIAQQLISMKTKPGRDVDIATIGPDTPFVLVFEEDAAPNKRKKLEWSDDRKKKRKVSAIEWVPVSSSPDVFSWLTTPHNPYLAKIDGVEDYIFPRNQLPSTKSPKALDPSDIGRILELDKIVLEGRRSIVTMYGEEATAAFCSKPSRARKEPSQNIPEIVRSWIFAAAPITAEILLVHIPEMDSLLIVNVFSKAAHFLCPEDLPEGLHEEVFTALSTLMRQIVSIWTLTEWQGPLKCSTQSYSCNRRDAAPLLLKYAECACHFIRLSRVAEKDLHLYLRYFADVISNDHLPYSKKEDRAYAPMRLVAAQRESHEGSGPIDITYGSLKELNLRAFQPLHVLNVVDSILWIGCGAAPEICHLMVMNNETPLGGSKIVALELLGDASIVQNIEAALSFRRKDGHSTMDLSTKLICFVQQDATKFELLPQEYTSRSILYSAATMHPNTYKALITRFLQNGGRYFLLSIRWMKVFSSRFLADNKIPYVNISNVSLAGSQGSFTMVFMCAPEHAVEAIIREIEEAVYFKDPEEKMKKGRTTRTSRKTDAQYVAEIRSELSAARERAKGLFATVCIGDIKTSSYKNGPAEFKAFLDLEQKTATIAAKSHSAEAPSEFTREQATCASAIAAQPSSDEAPSCSQNASACQGTDQKVPPASASTNTTTKATSPTKKSRSPLKLKHSVEALVVSAPTGLPNVLTNCFVSVLLQLLCHIFKVLRKSTLTYVNVPVRCPALEMLIGHLTGLSPASPETVLLEKCMGILMRAYHTYLHANCKHEAVKHLLITVVSENLNSSYPEHEDSPFLFMAFIERYLPEEFQSFAIMEIEESLKCKGCETVSIRPKISQNLSSMSIKPSDFPYEAIGRTARSVCIAEVFMYAMNAVRVDETWNGCGCINPENRVAEHTSVTTFPGDTILIEVPPSTINPISRNLSMDPTKPLGMTHKLMAVIFRITRGGEIDSGHYVIVLCNSLEKNESWTLVNDEKIIPLGRRIIRQNGTLNQALISQHFAPEYQVDPISMLYIKKPDEIFIVDDSDGEGQDSKSAAAPTKVVSTPEKAWLHEVQNRYMPLLDYLEEREETEKLLSFVFHDSVSTSRKIEIDKLLANGDLAEELTDMAPAGVSITRHDFQRITGKAGDGWLNDEAINGYFTLVQLFLKNTGITDVIVTSSFFFHQLYINNRPNMTALKDWGGRNHCNYDWYTLDTILVPTNKPKAHWSLLIVCPTKKVIVFCDSLLNLKYAKECLQLIHEWFILRAQEDCNSADTVDKEVMFKRLETVRAWELVIAKSVPQQKNGKDCGLCTLLFAHKVIQGFKYGDLSFAPDVISEFRYKLANSLLRHRFTVE